MGATNSTLVLDNVQLTNTGNYSVLVTNLYGSTNSDDAMLTVNDALDHFIWSPIPSPRFVNVPFAVVIQAQDALNQPFTNFTGVVNLESTNGITVYPLISSNFVQGAWAGSITVSQVISNLILQADDGFGHLGLANPINIVSLPPLTTLPSGNTLYIYWPISPSGFVLETTPTLSPANWTNVPAPPLQIGNQYLEPIQIMSGTNAFYRLRFRGP
jgi:hypothetical protein